jgi:hypothetical protein
MAYVQSASTGQDAAFGGFLTSITLALPNPCAPGNTLVVDLAYKLHTGASGAVSMFDSDGNAWTRITQDSFGSSVVGECWYAPNIVQTYAPDTITVAFTGTSGWDSMAVAFHEYAGILHASPVDTHGTATVATPNQASANITTGYDLEQLHGFAGSLGAPGLNLVGGQFIPYYPREYGGSPLLTVHSFDFLLTLAHPAAINFAIVSGVSIPVWHFGCTLVAFKLQYSPTTPAFSWLMLNEQGLGYTDRTNYLHIGDGQSKHSWTMTLRSRGTAEIPMYIAAGDPYMPTEGVQVYLYDQPPAGPVLVFAGTVDKLTISWLGTLGDRIVTLSAVSFEQVYDALLVSPRTYFYTAAEDIFLDLLSTVAQGVPIVGGSIVAPFVINTFTCNWERLSDLFNQIAQLAECVWGIDLPTLSVYLHAPNVLASPYTVMAEQVLYGSATWQQNRQDYRNFQAVRISLDAFSQSAELFPYTGLPATFIMLRAVESVTFAWLTKNTQNTATLTFSGIPAPGDTVTVSYPQSGSIYNWQPNAPYYTGQIVIDPANHVQKCTVGNSPGGSVTDISGSTQPVWNDTGGTTTDHLIIWQDLGVSEPGGLGAAIYTFVDALDNREWGQVLLGLTAFDCAFNLCVAINADRNQLYVGNVYSWPTWENPLVNAEIAGGAAVEVKNKNAGQDYKAALTATGSAMSWSSAVTTGGSTSGGTVLLGVASVGSSNSSNVYYNPGQISVSLASLPTTPSGSGWYIQIQYKRAAGDVIAVEDTGQVAVRSAIENGTGKYQQLVSDTSNTSNTLGLQQVQAILAAYSTIPVSFSFIAWKPGIAPGQQLTIHLAALRTFTGVVNTIVGGIGGPYLIQWVSGDLFTADMVGQPMTLSGHTGPFPITVFDSGTVVETSRNPGGFSGLSYSIVAPTAIAMSQQIDGDYVVQEVAAEIVPAQPYMDQAGVPGGGHYQYTVTVINTSQVESYLAFWEQMAGGGGGGGSVGVIGATGPSIDTGSPYDVVCSLTGLPAAAQTVLILTFNRAVSFAGNFGGSHGTAGVNPTATATYTVKQNGSSIGTVVVSTGGVVTFTTTSGAAQTFAAGDRMQVIAPSSADATLADVAITFAGAR